VKPVWDPRYRLCLIAVSGPTKGKKGWYKGYPDRYKIGVPIHGLDGVDGGALVFHSGTDRDPDGKWITTGGRVLCIVSEADTLAEARLIALQEIRKVSFEGMYFRSDIGKD